MSNLDADSSSDVDVADDRSSRPGTDKGLQASELRTIGAVIRAGAALRPKQAAIVGSQFSPLSYRELQDQIDEVRACLRQAGLGRDARIAVATANSAEAAPAGVSSGAS